MDQYKVTQGLVFFLFPALLVKGLHKNFCLEQIALED